jgi:TIR domain-containing protein
LNENSEDVQMKVFLSWSGERSRAIAEAMREWIPNVIQAVEPWMSAEDVDKGLRWSSEIAVQLEGTRFGIICLTPDNLESPWILFEAGALSKTIDKAFVCPFLFGLEPSDVRGPLTQFQATKTEKDDTKRLITTINRALGDHRLGAQKIETAFEHWWPDLEPTLRSVRQIGGDAKTERSDRELLEEVLEVVRAEGRDSLAVSERRDLRSLLQRLQVFLMENHAYSKDVLVAIEGLKRDQLVADTNSCEPGSYSRIHRQNGAPVVAMVRAALIAQYAVSVRGPNGENGMYDGVKAFKGLDSALSFADDIVAELYPHNCSNEACERWRQLSYVA